LLALQSEGIILPMCQRPYLMKKNWRTAANKAETQ
jgi:hypothetical protein